MSTSGIYSIQYTSDQLTEAALRKLGVLADQQTPSTENYANGRIAQNFLFAELRTLKIPLWKRNVYSFSPTVGNNSYLIGTGQTLNTPYPLHVFQAWRQDSGNTTKVPLQIISNYDYNQYPLNSGGLPLQLTYQPKVNYGEIKVWPVPDASAAANSTIYISYQEPFQYVVSGSDTIDFPEEFHLPIVYRLAVLLAPEWGIPLMDRQALKAEANEYMDRVLTTGEEDASFFIEPRRR